MKNIIINKYFWVITLFISIKIIGQNYYEKGINAYYSDDNNAALDFFTKAIDSNQEKAKSYMMRGACEIYMGDFRKGASDLNESLFLDSTYYKTFFYMGKLYLFQGFSTTAIKYYKLAYSKNKMDPNILDELAVAYSKLNEYEQAINYENDAISLDKSVPEYFLNRGYFYLKNKNYENALLDYNKSLELKEDAQAYTGRAYVYMEKKEYQKAIADFTVATKLMPESIDTYFYRALCYKALNNQNKACEDYNISLQLGYKSVSNEFLNYCK